MKRIAISLAGLWLGISIRALGEIQCVELEGAKLQAQMEYLQRDRSRLNAGCITYAMFQIALPRDGQSFARYPEAVQTIVGYLDYRPPDVSKLSAAVSQSRSRYPATDALFIIGKPVVSDLVETIANPATSDISRFNALSIVFAIYSREDVAEAVRILKSAAKAKESTNWEASQRLVDAARKTAGMCQSQMSVVCMDALFGEEKDTKH
jgi:hypothetical protein